MFKNSKFNSYPELIVDEPVEIRLAHAKDIGSSSELLEVLAKDKFWYVRYFVSLNSSTPKECLNCLCDDSDFRIRDAAKSNLSELGAFDRPALDDTLRAARDIVLCNVVKDKHISNEASKDIDI